MKRLGEEWRNFMVLESGDAAPDACDVEGEFGMCLGKSYKFIDIRFDGVHTALHGGDGVALPLQADSLPPYSTELVPCDPSSAATMKSIQIAAKDKYLVGLQLGNEVGCIFLFHC